ncbi:MAG: AAA family ATPase, partial [Paludibacteraceae bacterium]|nr:AAA family ATPase [Paludibacteraceae bacterium]
MKSVLLQQRHERDYLAAKSYQKRYINIPIKDYLQSPLIKVVSGARRAGKSVFCLQMLDGTNYAYLNFDDNKLLQDFDEDRVTQLLQEVYPDYEYLLLDEIQNLDRWELWIEKLYRRGTNLILTGSNAKLLSSELSTVLTGRYLKIEILPFSLKENLSYLKIDQHPETPEQCGKFMHEVDEYMQYGGYAEVIKSRTLTQTYLQGVYDTVLLKDII